MDEAIPAIFENGILRPLKDLSLRQSQRVVLHIDENDDGEDDLEDPAFLEYCRAEGDTNISLEAVREALAVIPGSMTEACSTERDEE
jgi:predicted DNA-binding antitoxin AbrB/MazE fold protein